MLTFHPVEISRDLNRDDPLYVGNFFDLKGMWWKKRKQRQGLVFSIAIGWYRLMKRNAACPGFTKDEVFITNLTRQVRDAKTILEAFFDIDRIGFNFNDGNKSPTVVSPKKLGKQMISAVEEILDEAKFSPGAPPNGKNLVQSPVRVQKNVGSFIRTKLHEEGRDDLLPAVNWILKHEAPIIFYFSPAGTLQQRDTSVWPIRSIELWPGWLRTALFGTVVDIENSYCQFIVAKLTDKYAEQKNLLELKYPDLLRMDRDKKNFREDLCRTILKREPTDDNLSIIKKLMMALANGSNATAVLMTNGSSRSEAVRIVREAAPDLLASELKEAGERLSVLARQFAAAKRDLCIYLLNSKPSRINQKKIFTLYFKWERAARYEIWNATGQTGLMLHDGLDGVVSDMTEAELIATIAHKTSIRVSVDNPNYEEVLC